MFNKQIFVLILIASLIAAKAYAGEIMVSSGTSNDLDAHRSPYASALKLDKEQSDVVGAAITYAGTYNSNNNQMNYSSYALVFYEDGTWSAGSTHRVDSLGSGKYVLPEGKHPKNIVGIGSDHETQRTV